MGKSTIVQLLERFYEPESGVIEIDGHLLTDCNLRWLRAQMALVSQEPKLFASTIAENIRAGKEVMFIFCIDNQMRLKDLALASCSVSSVVSLFTLRI